MMMFLFLLELNKLDDEKILLPLFMQAPKRVEKAISFITQMSVGYLTWCCKPQYKCKARKKQTSATCKPIGTISANTTWKVKQTTLE